MAELSQVLQPNVFKAPSPPLSVSYVQLGSLNIRKLNRLLSSVDDNRVGFAGLYVSQCVLKVLVISTATRALVVHLPGNVVKPKSKGRPPNSPGLAVLQRLLLDRKYAKFAFMMDKLAASLHSDYGLRIDEAVDMLSAALTDARRSLEALMTVLGGELTLHKEDVRNLLKCEDVAEKMSDDVVTYAWAAYKAGSMASTRTRLEAIARMNTSSFSSNEMDFLCGTIRTQERLYDRKPLRTTNDLAGTLKDTKKGIKATSSRYKTHIRRMSGNQRLEIAGNDKLGNRHVIHTSAVRVKGREAVLTGKLPHGCMGDSVTCTTVGKEPLTYAESQRADVMRQSLQEAVSFLRSPFVNLIWPLDGPITSWPVVPSSSPMVVNFPQRPLNKSQKRAVRMILSDGDDDRVTVIHGPPGTGKTTVIAAAVCSVAAAANERTIWLVAQSNVAVKNIAEKLAEVSFFNFKLLVSKEFHFDWHEHLYGKIVERIIRSDELPKDLIATERVLLNARVILCSLSMLSNSKLGHIVRLVPIETVIVDEASQIEIGDYIPLLHLFSTTLRKLVFIGDNCQLAPHGNDDMPELESIFEKPHLRRRAIFLETQYRMPVPIGNFISRNVYNKRLKTVHAITSPTACHFIDVHKGKERNIHGKIDNQEEVKAVVALVKLYRQRGRPYRIITPYDAQRGHLENALKSAKLPWEDKCFNVDSFQGNEEEHIIISLVRTDKLGFLKNKRRSNVMLTRCKKSMVICTKRTFLESNLARKSLVGKLAQELGPSAWLDSGNLALAL